MIRMLKKPRTEKRIFLTLPSSVKNRNSAYTRRMSLKMLFAEILLIIDYKGKLVSVIIFAEIIT